MRSRRLHPALAITGAVLVHALVLALAARQHPIRHTGAPPESSDSIEIDLAPLPAPSPHDVSAHEPQQREPSGGVARGLARRSAGARAEPSGPVELEPAPAGPAGSATPDPLAHQPAAPQRRIDLGLDGSLSRSLLLHPPRDSAPAPHRPSVGLLQEGLDARDAARGLSRSSQAIQAAYRAAGLAPPDSSAVFDVRTDALGNVLAVNLVSFGSNEERWTRVASAIKQQLRKHRLRVPPGASGLLTRLRIERGALANDVADLGRTERGVALGQDSLGPKDQREESTRSSQENGRITPTAGGPPFGAPAKRSMRVVLLSERPL